MPIIRKTEATSAIDTLRLVLPWVNGERTMDTNYVGVSMLLGAFVKSFDGSASAAFIDVQVARLEDSKTPPLTGTVAEQFETLRLRLRAILAGDDDLPYLSLRFSVRGARLPAKRSQLTWRQRHAYDGPGARVLRVEGSLLDLVPYCLMRLLTAPDMMRIARCPAPRAGDWKTPCGKWFVQSTGAGRPREFCTDKCKVRYDYAQENGSTTARRAVR